MSRIVLGVTQVLASALIALLCLPLFKNAWGYDGAIRITSGVIIALNLLTEAIYRGFVTLTRPRSPAEGRGGLALARSRLIETPHLSPAFHNGSPHIVVSPNVLVALLAMAAMFLGLISVIQVNAGNRRQDPQTAADYLTAYEAYLTSKDTVWDYVNDSRTLAAYGDAKTMCDAVNRPVAFYPSSPLTPTSPILAVSCTGETVEIYGVLIARTSSDPNLALSNTSRIASPAGPVTKHVTFTPPKVIAGTNASEIYVWDGTTDGNLPASRGSYVVDLLYSPTGLFTSKLTHFQFVLPVESVP